MADRLTIFQAPQIGVETTPGTAVPATRRFTAAQIQLMFDGAFKTFAPNGHKTNTRVTLRKEHTKGTLSGPLDYNEVTYWFASMFGNKVTTTLASTASQHTFSFNDASSDTIPYFTIEQGSALRAQRAARAQLTGIGLNFDRGADNAELTGDIIATQLQDGSVYTTTGVTALAEAEWLPNHLAVYIDPTLASIGGTKLTRVFKADVRIGGKVEPVFTLDPANPSYATSAEKFPTFELDLTVEADAAGMAALTQARAADLTQYVRLRSTGGPANGVDAYSCTIDLACKISEIGGFTDEQGIYTVPLKYTVVSDPSGFSHLVTLVNTVATL